MKYPSFMFSHSGKTSDFIYAHIYENTCCIHNKPSITQIESELNKYGAGLNSLIKLEIHIPDTSNMSTNYIKYYQNYFESALSKVEFSVVYNICCPENYFIKIECIAYAPKNKGALVCL